MLSLKIGYFYLKKCLLKKHGDYLNKARFQHAAQQRNLMHGRQAASAVQIEEFILSRTYPGLEGALLACVIQRYHCNEYYTEIG